MAIFRADENTLDYFAIRDGGVTIYRNPEFLEEDVRLLKKANYWVYEVDCATWVSDKALHESLKGALSFPDYYGKNFDALNDVVTDIDVPDDGGVALVLTSYDLYASGPGASLIGGYPHSWILLDILSHASHAFILSGRRFLTLIQSSDPRMHYEGLGCHAARWNRREELHKNRGPCNLRLRS